MKFPHATRQSTEKQHHFMGGETNRRTWGLGALCAFAGALVPVRVSAQPAVTQTATLRPHRMAKVLSENRVLREMQIYEVKSLGLEIWIENQPAWEVGTQMHNGRPTFTARSPENYHPPAAMTVAAWQDKQVTDMQFADVARSAIRHGSQNFGVSAGEARSIAVLPAVHGGLQGWEADFAGHAQSMEMDVRLFVGRASGRYPVVLTMYTMRGKMVHLNEVVRRGWGNLAYMD
jgi:hypothetical protein